MIRGQLVPTTVRDGKDIRVGLQIPPSSHERFDYTQKGEFTSFKTRPVKILT